MPLTIRCFSVLHNLSLAPFLSPLLALTEWAINLSSNYTFTYETRRDGCPVANLRLSLLRLLYTGDTRKSCQMGHVEVVARTLPKVVRQLGTLPKEIMAPRIGSSFAETAHVVGRLTGSSVPNSDRLLFHQILTARNIPCLLIESRDAAIKLTLRCLHSPTLVEWRPNQ